MYILDFIPSYFAFLLQLTKTRIPSKVAYLIHIFRISVSSRHQQIYRIGDSFISIFDSNTTCSLTLYSSLRSVQAAIVRYYLSRSCLYTYVYTPTGSGTHTTARYHSFINLTLLQTTFFVILLLLIIILLLLLLNQYNSTTLQLYIFQLSNSPSLPGPILSQLSNSPTLPPTNLLGPILSILLLHSSYNMQHCQTQQNPT